MQTSIPEAQSSVFSSQAPGPEERRVRSSAKTYKPSSAPHHTSRAHTSRAHTTHPPTRPRPRPRPRTHPWMPAVSRKRCCRSPSRSAHACSGIRIRTPSRSQLKIRLTCFLCAVQSRMEWSAIRGKRHKCKLPHRCLPTTAGLPALTALLLGQSPFVPASTALNHPCVGRRGTNCANYVMTLRDVALAGGVRHSRSLSHFKFHSFIRSSSWIYSSMV